jgi:hypothetical protein
MKLLATLFLSAALLPAAPNALLDGRIARVQEHPVAHRVWLGSIGFMAAGQAADLVSSIGGRELNPALRGSTGEFSVSRGLAVKGLLVGGVAGLETLTNRHGEHDKFYSGINAAFGVLGFGAAAHNWRVK